MKNKSFLYYVFLFIGIGLFCVGGFMLKEPGLKSISGICIGIGAGLFGMSLGVIIDYKVQERNPSYKRQMNIEAKDGTKCKYQKQSEGKGF